MAKTLTIEIEIPDCVSDEFVTELGEHLHNRFTGKPDYIENRILLNIDNGPHLVIGDDAHEKQYGIDVAFEAVAKLACEIKNNEK